MTDYRCRRCDWRPDVDLDDKPVTQLAIHAIDAAHPLCRCCPRSLTRDETWTCETCLTETRTLLSGIVTMYDELPRHLARLGSGLGGSGRRSERALPGGDALVLLGAGSEGLAEDGTTTHDGDLASVSFELGWWAAEWQGRREELRPLGSRPSTVVHNAAAYLDVRARWAADEHPGFADFTDDLRRIHTALEHATGRSRKAARANASCFDCKGQLVRRVDPRTGLEDEHVTCDRCHRRYTPAEYALALRSAYDSGLQGWVPIADAAKATKRSLKTVESWIHRGLVDVACRLSDRRQVVWWPHVDARARRAPRRAKRVA